MSGGEWVAIAGLVIQTLLILGGGYAMVVRADMITKALQDDVKAMKNEVKGLASVVTTQAVHSERMDNMSKRVTMLQAMVEELRRGRGYIQERIQHPGVDGEYSG